MSKFIPDTVSVFPMLQERICQLHNAFSRAPSSPPSEADEILVEEASYFHLHDCKEFTNIRAQTGNHQKCFQEKDEVCNDYCQAGWPEKKKLTGEILSYYHKAS